MENKSPKLIRVTVYIDQKDYRRLKSSLALKGLTISEWFRRMAAKESDEENV
jgi:hypothetical protein